MFFLPCCAAQATYMALSKLKKILFEGTPDSTSWSIASLLFIILENDPKVNQLVGFGFVRYPLAS
jgi:hypothetical protein